MATLTPHTVEVAPPDTSRWESGPHSPERYVQAFHAPTPGADVLISALVHGNEYAGAIVLGDLLTLLAQGRLRVQRGRVTALFANVDSFARFDPSAPDASRYADCDMNRVWRADWLNGPERNLELDRARAIRPFVERATHLLDLHSMHEPCEPLLITGLLPRNLAFARALGGLGQVVMDAGHQDGVRMRDFGDFGRADGEKIALLLEAGQHWQHAAIHATRDVLLRFLLRTGVIAMEQVQTGGLEGWLVPQRNAPPPVRVTHAVVAKSMQFEFAGAYVGNEVIATAGTVIAHDDGAPIITPYDNCVLVMPSVRQLRPGVTTVRLGHRD